MIQLECGIKAFDLHELLIHFTAVRRGYYEQEGINVALRDYTFVPDAELPQKDYFQVACGSAFLARRQDAPFKVFLVGTLRPMFWMHAAPTVDRIEDLAGRRVATYPAFAPPHLFHRIVLRKHGLDPDRDLSFEPVRDDDARLGLLETGHVQAAAVSSAVSPIRVRQRGLKTLALFGDHVTMATTGVAASEWMLAERRDVLAAIVRIFRRALEDIHTNPDEVIPVVARLLHESDDVARATYELVLPCYTRDGRADVDVLQSALDTVGAEIGDGTRVDASELYDFSLLDA